MKGSSIHIIASLLVLLVSMPLWAGNAPPVDCAMYAYNQGFGPPEASRLCSGATSRFPVQCFWEAGKVGFSTEESITICVGASEGSATSCPSIPVLELWVCSATCHEALDPTPPRKYQRQGRSRAEALDALINTPGCAQQVIAKQFECQQL